MANPIVSIQMESGEIIRAELFCDRAPFNTEYFLSYAKTDYYEWVPFHTCIKDKVICGGYYEKEGKGYGGEEFAELFEDEGDYNSLGHDEVFPYSFGMLALVEPQLPETSRQQFAVLFTDEPIIINGRAVIFRPIGRIIEGLELARNISHLPVDENFYPIDINPAMVRGITFIR